MKKMALLLVGLFLSFGFSKADVVSETALETQSQTVVLNLEFSTFWGSFWDEYQNVNSQGDCIQFYCREAMHYGIYPIDVCVRNVNVHHPTTTDYGTSYIQLIDGGAGYSEIAPGTVTPNTYVDISRIQVQSRGNYTFIFNVTGLPSR